MRRAIRIAAALGWMLVCLAGYALLRPFGLHHHPTRAFLAGVSRIAGLRVTVEGTPATAPVLWAANHVSWLDILALGGLGAGFVSKAEVQGWPLLGLLARLGGTIFVRREDRAQAGAQAGQLASALRGGRPVVLFAEGTTGDGVTIRPFRPALFAAAVDAELPVQPVALLYAGTDGVGWTEDEPFGANAARILGRPTTALTIRFLPPIAPGPDRKALAAQAHAAVAASVGGAHPV